MCHYCNKASSISDAVETASALLYFIAILCALGVFAMQLVSSRSDTPIVGPRPTTLLISLLVFYVAVEAAKVFWVPLKALTDKEVEKEKSTSSKIVIAVAIFFLVALSLEKCGF